jgi:cytochrome c556
MKTRTMLTVSVLTVAVFVILQPGQTVVPGYVEGAVSERKIFMRQKLAMVNRIVEGLTTEDFELVTKGGNELSELSESAAWASDGDPFYRHYSSNFEQAIGSLLTAADARSPEKVTFAYMHVMVSCTACHQHVRNTTRLSQ